MVELNRGSTQEGHGWIDTALYKSYLDFSRTNYSVCFAAVVLRSELASKWQPPEIPGISENHWEIEWYSISADPGLADA